jgi:hypothetical protein
MMPFMRLRFFLCCAALAAFGCGQTTSGDDGGPDAKGNDGQISDVQGLDQITTGCVNGSSQNYSYDAGACTPQLESSYSCSGSICSWNVIIPCTSDAGTDGGDGGIDCQSICNAVQPTDPHSTPGFCQPGSKNDAGMSIICGGCGI